MASLDPIMPERCRFLIRLPSPFWLGSVTLMMIAMYAALRIGVPIYRQQTAIREVRRLGGSVATESRVPEWLRELAGEDRFELFDAVFNVNLESSDVADDTLSCVASLPEIEFLSLHDTQVSDRGLVHLRGLTRLQSLNLGGTQVTGSGLAELKGLSRLRTLWLDSIRVTDAGIAELLAALPNLEVNPFVPPCGLGVVTAEVDSD